MPCINGNFVSNIVVLILETAKFWEIWVMRMTWCCMQCIVKNNVVSGREDESKNIFWLPTCACKKLWLQMHHFGWSPWIFPKHLKSGPTNSDSFQLSRTVSYGSHLLRRILERSVPDACNARCLPAASALMQRWCRISCTNLGGKLNVKTILKNVKNQSKCRSKQRCLFTLQRSSSMSNSKL